MDRSAWGIQVRVSGCSKANGAYDRDILRLVIDDGPRRKRFWRGALPAGKGIAVETADIANIVLICTAADTAEDFELLSGAFRDRSNYKIRRMMTAEDLKQVYLPQVSMPMRRAFLPNGAVCLWRRASDALRRPREAYPPGVPVILPGQKITEDMVDYLVLLRKPWIRPFRYLLQ